MTPPQYDNSHSSARKELFYYCEVLKNPNYEELVAKVVRRLRLEREQQGRSMSAVARAAGISQSIVSLIEHDLRSPTLETLLRLADALEVDLGKLITLTLKK